MPVENVRVKYTGSALPGNAEVVSIFDTTAGGGQMGAAFCATAQLHRLYVTIINSQAGTLKSWSSEDRGKNWTQIDSLAVSAASAGTENPSDWLVEPYLDWKLEWTNGATPQTVFRVASALQGERGPGA
jgi:hypothetical protein